MNIQNWSGTTFCGHIEEKKGRLAINFLFHLPWSLHGSEILYRLPVLGGGTSKYSCHSGQCVQPAAIFEHSPCISWLSPVRPSWKAHPQGPLLLHPMEEVWSALYKSNVDGGISNMKRWPGPGGGGVTSRMVKVHCPLGAGLEGIESHPRHGIADCGRDVLGRCVVRVVHAGMRVGIIPELCYNSENSLWDSMTYLLFLNQECFGMETSHIGLLFTTKD